MFLKRRDLFAWILLLAAAIMIIYGRQMMGSGSTSPDNISETRAYLTINEALGESASAPAIQETTALAAGDGNIQETFVVESTSDVPEDDSSRQGFRGRIPSFILIFLGIGAGNLRNFYPQAKGACPWTGRRPDFDGSRPVDRRN